MSGCGRGSHGPLCARTEHAPVALIAPALLVGLCGLSAVETSGAPDVAPLAQARPAAQPGGPPTAGQSAAKLVVVMINGVLGADVIAGAGLVVGVRDGDILVATARHVVRRGPQAATGLEIRFGALPDRPFPAELLPESSERLDLAVLRVPSPKPLDVAGLPSRVLGDPSRLRRGDAVYHMSFAGGRGWRSNVAPDLFSEIADEALFFESLTVGPGASGGGLFNQRWELVGMVIADQAPDGKALSIDVVLQQLRDWGYQPRLAYTVYHATWIAFMSNRDGRGDTYVMRPDGSAQRRLTRNQTEAMSNRAMSGNDWNLDDLAWAPDGKSLLVVKAGESRDSREEILRVSTDGAVLANLTKHRARDMAPAWSPDGTRVAFLSDRSGRIEIYAMNADGRNVVPLTRNTPANTRLYPKLAWSPNSRKVAFVVEHDTKKGRFTAEIHVAAADGSQRVQLTRNDTSDWEPAWSPDGSKLAFLSSRDGQGVYVMEADGSDTVRLTSEGGGWEQLQDLSWSPDGTRILFSAVARAPISVWVVASNGSSAAQQLSGGEWHDHSAVWSPDGGMIAFWSDRYGHDFMGSRSGDICVMNADGSDPRCLTRLKNGEHDDDVRPSWSPFFR